MICCICEKIVDEQSKKYDDDVYCITCIKECERKKSAFEALKNTPEWSRFIRFEKCYSRRLNKHFKEKRSPFNMPTQKQKHSDLYQLFFDKYQLDKVEVMNHIFITTNIYT